MSYNSTRRRDEGLITLDKSRRPLRHGVPAAPFSDGSGRGEERGKMNETIAHPFAVDCRGVLYYLLGTRRRAPVGMTWVTV